MGFSHFNATEFVCAAGKMPFLGLEKVFLVIFLQICHAYPEGIYQKAERCRDEIELKALHLINGGDATALRLMICFNGDPG